MSGITFTGLNGIDFNSILESVMQYESLPLLALQNEETKIHNKDSAFVSLAGIISALQSPVSALTGSSAFSNVTASSTNPSVASATSGSGALAGQYQVSVSQLARNQVTKSANGFAASSDVAANGGSISFTINGETTEAINITADTTLADLAQQINSQNSGVAASVVNDGTSYRLVISSRATGETNGFTINNSLTNSGGAAVAFAAGQSATSGNVQNAQNAIFTVNGLDIQRASNTVTDAIPGVTLTVSAVGSAALHVTNDYTP